jgi:cyclic beta-1,2-glucan synthetase
MADHITQTQATHAEAAQIDLGSSQQQQEENEHLSPAEQEHLRHDAQIIARGCAWLPPSVRSGKPRELFRRNVKRLNLLEKDLYELKTEEPSDDLRWLYDNLRLVRTDLQDLHDGIRVLAKLPSVRTGTEEAIPRCIVLSRALLAATHNRLTEEAFTCYLEAVQTVEPLRLSELSGMLLALKLSLLELLAQHGRQALDAFRAQGEKATSYGLGNLITSLRLIGWVDWRNTLERLSLVHHALKLDPCGAYSRMEFVSREAYRMRVARIAGHSDVGEIELAQLAVTMAEEAAVERDAPEALRERLRHVGYYLMDDVGSKELLHRVGYRRGFAASIQHVFRAYPDETYIIGIEFASLITVVVVIMSLVRSHEGFGLIIAALLLLLPATQAAVELMNYLVTAILTPHALSKLDFSQGIDPACATMVAIPTLLINDKQIRELVDDLEIRYLVNRDPHIFFALLTDLPDTAEPAGDEDARVDLALRLINGLNRRYAGAPYGGFYMFHRHRVYNPREGAWMGFERKRGKLLDLNQLLRSAFDPFPVKAGDLSLLPKIRYVLTLDSDTKLPRGSAHRMIGTMAHPLNQPLVDPELNIVTRGYGILQPRVGISVQSSTRSRLANIYSGQTGFDIYSRAVSDVYQDLYGEGIFTGKGIYDVDALRQVLEHRFPRNALLSHDLIEGAYARAGLASDIEVIDDYPSHYSAYNRRKHRWLRGDWQIVRWILNKVPDESRRLVRNPISLVSRWKIVDNLRRSLMEPATFFLLVAGWFFLPGGPGFWTCISLALLFLPIYFRLIFALIAAASVRKWDMAHEAFIDFFTSHINIVLNLAFLAHQALVSIDAIVRTVIRIYVTHSRLLEWETATEAELGIQKRTPVDIYLNWLPALTVCLALALFLRPAAAPWALPLLITWGCSKFISTWLNRPPHGQDVELSPKDRVFLRGVALRTWRYFEKFSNEGNHYLIPDNVREQPFRVDERVSPTNLGLLLNSRQAALEFGYLTHDEFMSLTEKTFESILKLPRFHGHFTNWYDTLKMQPIGDLFLSSVDNGNFVASLWSLKEGCLDLLHEPLLRQSALDSLSDHHRASSGKANSRDFWNGLFKLSAVQEWLPRLLRQAPGELGDLQPRVDALREQAQSFTPWYLPDYEPLRGVSGLDFGDAKLTPSNCASYYRDLENRLQQTAIQPGISGEVAAQARRLRDQLPDCRRRLETLAARLQTMYDRCQRLSDEMNFSMLVDKGRNLLSIGYDARAEKLNKACYDLLASEARSATFITVAKGEAIQDAWFKLGRQHTVCEKEMAMISWTGTMFEYLMPAIWMKSHPNTLLDRAARSAVRAQQSYGKNHRVPWGISEAAYSKTDADGNFQYAAFGVPGLALNVARAGSLVISPYSSCLALAVDPVASVQNLMVMARKDWLAEYGFYESADYTGSSGGSFRERKYKLVHCWMAHHQGMSLAAICNTLYNDVFQRWFHADRLVQASDLILQERPLRVKPIADFQPRRVMAFDAKSSDAHAN